ncbi:type I-C CRISPR-associated protein Cas8c/Csd1 [Alkalicaulis satelles]|uniref:Type I-C CRISPR-associated protein Cas8c/Csd1 n=1 Tax=Alkalicaulis satelles TaxID=2609175 RepID=A0A5M6ZIR6_9PROT|nr:type I-C CRISPR-associated protein Cas8c/Csd1 [Alkalicaulis satelles]KAA5803587.1 type I-C CRISPR-associated protein Cas8c/Csd1 [Alkalicaulis satelles]
MSILQALDGYYHRLDQRGEVTAPGWSPEKFGWCIVLAPDGTVVDVENLHDLSGKKPRVKLCTVPAAVKRTVGIAPNFLWDKTAYVLGRTAGSGKRTADEHDAFRTLHLDALEGEDDEGLVALRAFLTNWTPERFDQAPFMEDMLDANVMFRLKGERRYLHERPAARALVARRAGAAGDEGRVICLITGETGPPARLHPTIKGVEGAQSSGAALVSFNLDAFTSLDKEQGENAPTSQAAAFRYGAALNHLLTRDGPNRLRRPVGDATVIFWADAREASAAKLADSFFAKVLDADVTDEAEAALISDQLKQIAKGKPLKTVRPDIAEGTRFHVLGLSPNAARLSVRFWLSDEFEHFANALAQHHADLSLEPAPLGWGAAPSVSRLLVRTTAAQGDFKNIPPLLAGEVMRAVLTGTSYPQSLLSAAIMRLRAGDSAATGWHAAVIRAVLNRQRRHSTVLQEREIPVGLDRQHDNTGYQLGRLFAVYEMAQRAALGNVNATIRDRYFGAASATPAGVFPLIVRGGQNHLSKVRKEKPGWAALIERELEEINSHFKPGPGGIWPRSLRLADQGEFAIGYYHQRATKLTNEKGDALSADIADSETEGTDA